NAAAQVVISANADTTECTGCGILFIGQLIAASPLIQTTLKVTFPGPIVTTGSGVHIEGASGVFANVTAETDIVGGIIRLTLPGADINTLSGSFRLVGIKLPQQCGLIALSLNSLTNNYLLSSSSLGPQPPPALITSTN